MQHHGRRPGDNPQAPGPQATDPQATDQTETTAGGLIAVANRTGPGDLCNAIGAGVTGTNDRDKWPI